MAGRDVMKTGRLLLVDVQEVSRKTLRPLILGVTGAMLLLASFPVLLFGLAWLLSLTGLAMWASLLIAAAAGILVSGGLGWFAWRTLRTTVAVFERSRDEFSQNLTWIKTVLRSGSRRPKERV